MLSSDTTTLATYVYLLHRAGVPATGGGATLAGACKAIDAGDEAAAGPLVDAVGAAGGSAEAVLAALYGADRLAPLERAPDRESRLALLRRARFGSSLPFLARIAHREGEVLGERWVIVERLADEVSVLDPNPWDDKDEAHALPVADFAVRWELGGLGYLAVRA